MAMKLINLEVTMYTSGEFSRMSGLTAKMLRLYHEKGILVPKEIDSQTGYRYYDRHNFDQALMVRHLKSMEFNLEQIREIVTQYTEDHEIVGFLEAQKEKLTQKMEKYKTVLTSIENIIINEKEYAMKLSSKDFEVQEKLIKDQLIASVRFKGKYEECGKAFAKVAKNLGRYICGKAFSMYFNEGYQEIADIESGFPVSQGQSLGDMQVRQLKGGKGVCIIHKGPYDDLGRSYQKLTDYIKARNFKVEGPCREIYIKGPGMIFRGNPKNYLTEIQFIVSE